MARNYLADEFFSRTDATHLLFIDSDIHFNAQDVLAMLSLDLDLCGACYPKKTLNLKALKDAVLKNPDIEISQLENLLAEFVFNVKPGTKTFNVTEPVEVSELGTGFLMIKRNVFEKINEVYGERLRTVPDHVSTKHFDGSRSITTFFDVIIDKPTEILEGNSFRTLSEDYFFTRLATKVGFSAWLLPWIRTGHVGTYEFKGNMSAVAQYLGKL